MIGAKTQNPQNVTPRMIKVAIQPAINDWRPIRSLAATKRRRPEASAALDFPDGSASASSTVWLGRAGWRLKINSTKAPVTKVDAR